MRHAERRNPFIELLTDDGDARLRIVDVVAQLLRPVHRVDRHDHRIGAQDGVVGDEELRAVLQIEEHAVASGDAAALLQKTGERIGFALHLRVAEARAVVIDQRAIRMPLDGVGEVAVDAGARNVERARRAGRPVREVPIKHHQSA